MVMVIDSDEMVPLKECDVYDIILMLIQIVIVHCGSRDNAFAENLFRKSREV